VSAELRGAVTATAERALVGSLVAASEVVKDYPLAAGQTVRYALAAAVLVLLARGRLPRLRGGEALALAVLAATGLVLFNLFLIEGVREADPATVGVIVGCVPLVLALAGPLLAGRTVSAGVVAAAALVALGAAGVQWAGGGIALAGLLFALGALACEACFTLLAAPHLKRLGPLAVSAYACLFALPMLAAWTLVAHGPAPPPPSLREAAAIAHLAIPVTAIGFVAWYTAVGLLSVERAGLFSGVLPVSALLCSAALGLADITPQRLAAVAVVAAGITLGMRAAAHRPAPPPAHA
jgi:drug/metabolite transporter (DMT)-like permease